MNFPMLKEEITEMEASKINRLHFKHLSVSFILQLTKPTSTQDKS